MIALPSWTADAVLQAFQLGQLIVQLAMEKGEDAQVTLARLRAIAQELNQVDTDVDSASRGKGGT